MRPLGFMAGMEAPVWQTAVKDFILEMMSLRSLSRILTAVFSNVWIGFKRNRNFSFYILLFYKLNKFNLFIFFVIPEYFACVVFVLFQIC